MFSDLPLSFSYSRDMRKFMIARSRRECKVALFVRPKGLTLHFRAPCYTESRIEQELFVGRVVIRRMYGL